MSNTLKYSGFLIASLVIVFAFITARTYTQLSIAIIVYPLFILIAYKMLMKKNPEKVQSIKNKLSSFEVRIPPAKETDKNEVPREKVEITDVDKRTFLKIVGAAGLSYFVFSLLGRKAESLLFGRSNGTGIDNYSLAPKNQIGGIGNLPTEGYTISEIDDENIVTYYGFVKHDGAWFIMKEDAETNSYRYTRGGSNFSDNWGSRENLKYDYYYNLF
jgi:hypothetical protein